MKLLNTKTNEEFEAEINLATENDLRKIHNSEEFEFDWYAERAHPIYVIKRKEDFDAEVLGVMSLQDVKHEYRVHISLIEIEQNSQGRNKEIDRIAGCLIAFAVEISFEKQYYGFVSLTPKSEIIDWYQEKYGFQQFGRHLAIDGRSAKIIQNRYLYDK